MKEQIKALISQFGSLNVDVDTLGDSDDLFAAGMSSLNSVNLMLALEDHFDVEFPNEQLNRQTFESIDAIAEAIGGLVPSA
jgi:acyl carrier protein